MSNLLKKIKRFIPGKLHFKLVNLKHSFSKFRQTHYSQNGEDVILASIFAKDYKGFYVDVGAHHPYRISNTALLHEQGWTGINIDANPDTIELFKKIRPNDINLLAGVSNTAQELTYHKFSDPAVNTFSAEEAERWKYKKWLKYLGTTKISTSKLSSILSENIPAAQKIDVLNVDVEGLDLEVLQSNDWNLYSPKIVVVEVHTFDLESPENSPVYYFLKQKGYKLRHMLKFSLIFEK